MEFKIHYLDNHIVVIDKPTGFFVHRSSYDNTSAQIVLQNLRDQLQTHLFPVHRLDRKTSGLLVFALNKTAQSHLSFMFKNKLILKQYIAVVRGHLGDDVILDYPLITPEGKSQESVTRFFTLCKSEVPFVSSDRYPTSRYSLVVAQPETGRQHQIRRHLAHVRHPIIGDRPYGCSKQNRFFLEKWNWNRMLLHAWKMEIPALEGGNPIQLIVPPDEEFTGMLESLDLLTLFEISTRHITSLGSGATDKDENSPDLYLK